MKRAESESEQGIRKRLRTEHGTRRRITRRRIWGSSSVVYQSPEYLPQVPALCWGNTPVLLVRH